MIRRDIVQAIKGGGGSGQCHRRRWSIDVTDVLSGSVMGLAMRELASVTMGALSRVCKVVASLLRSTSSDGAI